MAFTTLQLGFDLWERDKVFPIHCMEVQDSLCTDPPTHLPLSSLREKGEEREAKNLKF